MKDSEIYILKNVIHIEIVRNLEYTFIEEIKFIIWLLREYFRHQSNDQSSSDAKTLMRYILME